MSARAIGLAALLLAAAVPAEAGIYRCGNEYSATPCREGREIDTRESVRSAEQRDEARQVAAAERKLADGMERDRLRAEAAIKPKAAGSLGSARPQAPATKALAAAKAKKKGKAGESDDFVAIAPKPKP